ncbi:S26 family signal peptidase [Sphingomonas colocasiae]|uniref:S26 family signal peptidase n=1 Tax=Sphingomonas colocasiae TaxID=1848973 RepID=A0ABS7PKP2_9SPHN|nr:S26 family signal peptidase [Sphingomonas colocasiae]MBY8821057.1 S26 family signal peptidase [Sphingomonas colocasiae]
MPVSRRVRPRISRKLLAFATLGVAMIALPTLLAPAPRLIWNASASAPIGFYLIRPGANWREGDTVLVRIPQRHSMLAAQRGYLPPAVPLIKRAAVIGPGTICARGEEILLDGEWIAQRRRADRQGRALPAWQGCLDLRSNMVFLLGEGPWSFDSRYFGPVPTDNVIGSARWIGRP